MNFPFLIKAIYITLISVLLAVVLYLISVNYNLFGLFGSMPSLEILENPKSEVASEIFSSDGEVLGKYFKENRSPVEYEQISPNLIKALLATEDIRFEEHSGIDMKGIFAILFYLAKGENRGSSTLSQQLAKNLFSTRSEKYEGILSSNGLMRKIIIKTKEWITAIKIERAYTKKEIITMYLNTVDFGSNAFGIKVAAQTFFSTTTDSLSVPQSAVLVGVLKAPSYYSPFYNPNEALNRRNTVLEQMEKYKYITNEELILYKNTPLTLKYNVENQNQGIATYFRTVVNNFLLNWCKKNGYGLYSDGLKIYTTLDSKLQKYAELAVEKHMKFIQSQFFLHWSGRNPWVDENAKEIPNFIENASKRTDTYRYLKNKYSENSDSITYYMNLKKKMKVFSWNGEIDTTFSSIDSIIYYKKFLNAGLLSVEPETGHIKAWVGGINHKYFKFDHVKQSKRQPGSTFKPFIYAAAMDNGYSPCFKVKDEPVSFYDDFTKTSYTPQNADGPSTGETLTLRQALSRSVNTIAAYLIKKLTPQTIVEYTKRLGIKGDLEPTPSLTYGVADISIYELVGAFCTFANKGTYTEPMFITRIEDKNGNLIEEFTAKREEVLNEETAYTMLYMLRGATEEKGGTGLGLRRYPNLWGDGNEIGGKTGTTQNSSDGWFVGVNQNLVSAVWVGGDDRSIHFRDLQFGQGSKLALPIFGLYMNDVYGDKATLLRKTNFKKPLNYSVQLDCSKYTNREPIKKDSTGIDIYNSDNNLDGIQP